MAFKYYGAKVGAMQPTDIAESGATTSRAVELVIDLSKTVKPMEVHQCLEAIRNYLRTVETNPIA